MSGTGGSGPYNGQMQSVHPDLGRVTYGPLSQLQDLQTFRRTGLVPFGQQEVQQPLILPPALPQFDYSAAFRAQQAAAQPVPIAAPPVYMNPENAGPGVGATDGAGGPGDGGGGGGGGGSK